MARSDRSTPFELEPRAEPSHLLREPCFMHHNQSVAATGSWPQVRLRLRTDQEGEKNNKWLSSVSATTVAARPSPRRPPINEQDSDMLELRLPRFWQRKTWSCRLPRNHRRRKYFAFTITEMMPSNFIAFCFCLFVFFLPSQLTASYPGRRLLIRHFFTAACNVLACRRSLLSSPPPPLLVWVYFSAH